jgi:hypothetical protein
MVDEKIQRQEVVIVDFQMPFWSMVKLMVKFALASIPALICLAFIGFFLTAILAGIGAGIGHR